MSDDFQRVKDAVTIGQIMKHYSSEVVKKFAKPCPGCDGSDCCSVDEGQGICNCFSCDMGGSIIDVVMKKEGVDKAEALKRCADIGNVEISAPSVSGSVKEKKEPAESGQNKILRAAMEHYKSVRVNVAAGKAADYFLKTRGHFDETMEVMQMGWTDGGLAKALRKEGFTTADLVNHGLAVDKDTDGKPLRQAKDFFWKRGMTVFPVLDHAGKVISLNVKDPEKKFTAKRMKGI